MNSGNKQTFKKLGNRATNVPIKNLKINVILAIYTCLLAIAVPSIFLSAIMVGGQQFMIPLYSLIVAGVAGVGLSMISLVISRRHNLQTTGNVLAVIGTIMVSTGVMMILFFIITPLLIVAAWFLLRPRERYVSDSVAVSNPRYHKKISVTRNGYELEKKRLNQIIASGDINLPFGFYFNTDLILKLIPIVGFSTIGIYISIWFSIRGKAQPESTLPMFLSMGLVLVVFVLIDVIIWLIWKQVARPIVILDHSGIYYRKRQHEFFVAWTDIDNLTNIITPSGQTRITCLFVFAKNPEKYIDTSLQMSHKKEKLKRWLHGIRPEYFQNEFPGVVLTIPIDRIGIEQQRFLNLVINVWKKNTVNSS